MVKGLTDKLVSILEDRRDSLSGEDIKHIVESIQLSESLVTVELDPKAKTPEKIMKEWMGE